MEISLLYIRETAPVGKDFETWFCFLFKLFSPFLWSCCNVPLLFHAHTLWGMFVSFFFLEDLFLCFSFLRKGGKKKMRKRSATLWFNFIQSSDGWPRQQPCSVAAPVWLVWGWIRWCCNFMFCLQCTCSGQVNAIGCSPVACNINSNHTHTQQLIVWNFYILI